MEYRRVSFNIVAAAVFTTTAAAVAASAAVAATAASAAVPTKAVYALDCCRCRLVDLRRSNKFHLTTHTQDMCA